MEKRPKTIFCDIDGTLIKHYSPDIVSKLANSESKGELLDGTLTKLREWDSKGYNIILTTGRKESLRSVTVNQLSSLGIFYDKLIMGIGGGVRVLINDLKTCGTYNTAIAINIERNKGIKDVKI